MKLGMLSEFCDDTVKIRSSGTERIAKRLTDAMLNNLKKSLFVIGKPFKVI